MITKPCLWCGLNMRVKTNEQWRSLHKECYKKHYVPVSKKYSFKYFEQNIDQMKSNEKESLASKKLKLQASRKLEALKVIRISYLLHFLNRAAFNPAFGSIGKLYFFPFPNNFLHVHFCSFV